MKRLMLIAMVVLLSAPTVLAQEPCAADFNCDQNVDATDVDTFLSQFGRNPFNDPCPDCYDSQCPCSAGTTCTGTLSALGRWCDQGDGTVKDMATGLVWLKKADWGGEYPFWVSTQDGTNAHDRAAQLWDGSPWEGTAALSDRSIEGDWRLPTQNELVGIKVGTEYIRSSSMYFFTGVQSGYYWSSTTDADYPDYVWILDLIFGLVDLGTKGSYYYVWPVRGGQ